jgi:hypothetical protein
MWGANKDARRILVGKPEGERGGGREGERERDNLNDLGFGGMIILKLALMK